MTSISTIHFPSYAHAVTVSNFFKFGGGYSGHDRSSSRNHIIDDAVKVYQETPDTKAFRGSGDESSSSKSQKDLDLITNLPGLNYDPGFNQYSGYLTVGDNDDDENESHQRNFFYWFVESQGSEDDGENTDPLIFWTNGGPGCSGLLGFGTEHGPFYFSQEGELSPNKYSWNQLANIIYVEIPVGVGFSYSNHRKDYTHANDKQTTTDSYWVIEKFLERFSEYRSNDFYIASESYGGHYMPQLALEIIQRNSEDDTNASKINFRGLLVGNPYVDPYRTRTSQFKAWYSHGLLPLPIYKPYADNCHDSKKYLNKECLKHMLQMYKAVGNGINYYALDYPLCLEKEVVSAGDAHNIAPTATAASTKLRQLVGASEQSLKILNQTAAEIFFDGNDNPPFGTNADHFRICADNHFIKYLQRKDVVSAIHARTPSSSWSECDDTVFLSYSKRDVAASQVPLYEELIDILQGQHLHKENKNQALMITSPFHILVFSGDDDSICSLDCTQAWIWDLGIKPKRSCYWKPWFAQKQTAGYVTQFHLSSSKLSGGTKADNNNTKIHVKDQSSSSSFTFATVHGAGHEVPLYRPMEALELLKKYLNHDW